MLDTLPAVIGTTSPIATALAMFYLVFTGRLYVRSAHNDVVRVLEAQITALSLERDTWRDSSLGKDATVALLAGSNAELLETAKFSTHVMSALQDTAGGTT